MKKKPPSLKQSLARWSSFGPLALSLSHVAQLQGRIDPRTERAIAAQPGSVVVIPFRGVVVPREDKWSQMFGEVGVEDTVRRIEQAVADKSVKSIIIDMDSPGGSVCGVTESVAKLRAIDTNKPIVAHADYLMCSAAYHFAMGCDEVNAAPSAEVGSIGVLWPYMDQQKMLEELGIEAQSFAYPADKGDGWGMWPNSDKFEERRAQVVKECYDVFVSDIVASRNVDTASILADWASVYNAPRAKLLGMVDKVRPIAETFGAYSSPETAGVPVALLKRQLELSRLKPL